MNVQSAQAFQNASSTKTKQLFGDATAAMTNISPQSLPMSDVEQTEKVNMKVTQNEEEKITEQTVEENPKVERLLHTDNVVQKVPPLKLNSTSSE